MTEFTRKANELASVYVEARECESCLHAGLNDEHATEAVCNECGWNGTSPKLDHCPDCELDGTMSAACPKCSGLYRLVASGMVAADPATYDDSDDIAAEKAAQGYPRTEG